MGNRRYSVGSSGLGDALIKIEGNTLWLQTMQTRGTVNLKLLLDAMSSESVTAIVVVLAGLAVMRLRRKRQGDKPRPMCRGIYI